MDSTVDILTHNLHCIQFKKHLLPNETLEQIRGIYVTPAVWFLAALALNAETNFPIWLGKGKILMIKPKNGFKTS